MQISQRGIDLIKRCEGFSPKPYKCPAGKNTIGYGHVIEKKPFLTSVTEEDAEIILRHELRRIEAYLKSVIKVKLTQGQIDALCSLVFNWGCGNFGKSKGLKYLNRNRIKQAEQEFFSKEKGIVNIAGKFSKGLYRRRLAEWSLWVS